MEKVRHLYDTRKEDVKEDGIVSNGQTQQEIDKDMVSKYPMLFQGLGLATWNPYTLI